MKIAVLLIGESFRLGGQHTRSRDDAKSYEDQKNACLSHVKFKDYLSTKGVLAEFIIESYSTKYHEDFYLWYGDSLKQCKLRDDLVGLEKLSSDGISDLSDEYDALLICRIDLFLKDMFMEIFNPHWEKVMFPFMCWFKSNHHLTRGMPRVSDNMMFVPKIHMRKLKGKLFLSHDSWPNFVNSKVLEPNELGVMINTYHDSDSAKDYNPLYRIVNRSVSKWWYGNGCVVGPEMMPLKTEEVKNFPDWSPKEILGEEGLKKYPHDTWEWWAKWDGDHFFCMNKVMNFSKDEIYGQTIDHENCDQSWWKLEDDKMIIFDCNKRISSVLFKTSEDTYCGTYEFDKRLKLMIKKVKA